MRVWKCTSRKSLHWSKCGGKDQINGWDIQSSLKDVDTHCILNAINFPNSFSSTWGKVNFLFPSYSLRFSFYFKPLWRMALWHGIKGSFKCSIDVSQVWTTPQSLCCPEAMLISPGPAARAGLFYACRMGLEGVSDINEALGHGSEQRI